MATKIILRFSLGILAVLLLGVFAIACGTTQAAEKNESPAIAQEAVQSVPVPQAEKPFQAPIQTVYATEKATNPLPSFSGEIPPLVKDAVEGFYALSNMVVPNEKVRERWIKFLEAETPPGPRGMFKHQGSNAIAYLDYQDGVVDTQACFGPCNIRFESEARAVARVQLFLKEREWKGAPMTPEVVNFKILHFKNNLVAKP